MAAEDQVTLAGLRAIAGWVLLPLGFTLAGQEIARYILPVFGFLPARSGSHVALGVCSLLAVTGWLCLRPPYRLMKLFLGLAVVGFGLQLVASPLNSDASLDEFSRRNWGSVITGVLSVGFGFYLLRTDRPDPAEPLDRG